MDKATPDFITRDDAPGERRLAVIASKGARSPAIIWLGGFRSDMRATKAEALAGWADRDGRRFVRFDYTGHGESEGDFSRSTISVWLADAMAVIAAEGGNAPILVGSSMGGWLALLAARIMQGGQWLRSSVYASEPYPITRALIEDGRHHLLFGLPIEPGCPVTILQGMQDPDVPWQHAMKLVEHLPADQVTLTLIKDGDHRLSRDQDIDLLIRAITALL
jgi:pimeloyl-ACP methyl ester carboxylesterase